LRPSLAIQTALDGGQSLADLASVAGGGVLIVFSMWWIYFDLPAEQVVSGARANFTGRLRGAFVWGYGHLVVFASAAAVGAGLAAAVDQTVGHAELTSREAALSVTVPVSVYLLSVWVLHVRYKEPGFARAGAVPIAIVAIVGSSIFDESVLVTGCLMVLLIAVSITGRSRRERERLLSAGDWQSG
jgi:low temperature requirement protein LtrA